MSEFFYYLCGMKNILSVIVVALVLVAVVTGCGGMHRYDARLAAADSLMHDVPDSALALVQAVDPASLTREGDRAYRDLLLTQARYRCYITATSDSDINRALAYYRHHDGEREKLTRAYIYKGAVMEELGYPDSAMLYYKHAEATAAPTDYFNLGYSKMRIAQLYLYQLSQDSAAIIRLKDAINNFIILNDTNYLIQCYGKLGAICGVRYPDSTEYYLSTAIQLAQDFNPQKQYTFKSKLAGFKLFYDKDYKNANILAMDVLRNGKDYSDERQFYYYASLSYIKMGLLDSARYIFNLTPAPVDKVDSMNHYDILSALEAAKPQPTSSEANAVKSANYTIDILSHSREKELLASEIEFEKQKVEKFNSRLIKHNNSFIFLLLFVSILLTILFLVVYSLRKKLNRQYCEFETCRKELEIALSDLEQQRKSYTEDVAKYVGYRISALNEIHQAIRVKKKGSKDGTRSVVPLSSLIKELSENNSLLTVNLSDSFWTKLKMSVDAEFNGIVSFVENRYHNMSETDIKLFSLLCAKISPQIIKVCMNYTNSKTSSTYRNRMIKKKIGLDMTFDEFIEQYMNGDIS